MEKYNDLVVYKGDMAVVEFRFEAHEPEGLFRYFPVEADRFRMIIHDAEQVLWETEINSEDPDYCYADVDTSELEPGTYMYDVIGKLDGEEREHHIIVNKKIKIMKECMS